MGAREDLDKLVKETISFNKLLLPNALMENVEKWKWGSYGWVSPASLFLTAAWHKYRFPNNDCCKIWALDKNKKRIPGSYSIRDEDEHMIIPVLAKYDLCKNFCSPNSGMQGSRAIEKMRSLQRLNTDFNNEQATVFDLKLFAKILNQVNELNKEQSLEFCRYLIVLAKSVRDKRIADAKKIESTTITRNIYNFLNEVHDPELTKCVAAACLSVIYNKSPLSLQGVSDAKTAADARAKKPGDLCLLYQKLPIVAIEVKDKTQVIDWNNIERAGRVIERFPSLRNFMFLLENREATTTDVIRDIISSDKIKCNQYFQKISIVSLYDLYLLALSFADNRTLAFLTSKFMNEAPSVKPETKIKWLAQN